jgi:hypothetical protein
MYEDEHRFEHYCRDGRISATSPHLKARLAGICELLEGVTSASAVFPAIAIASGLAELPLMIWLIAFDVNAPRWKEQAAGASGIT